MKTRTNRIWLTFMLAFSFSQLIMAQPMVVEGKVFDSKTHEVLIGVSVNLKGSTVGTITDNKGEFKIPSEPGKTLIFAYIGYKTKNVVIKSAKLEINMEENQNSLNEVVVVGYGTQKRRDLTGSVSNVSINVNNSPNRISVVHNSSQQNNEEYGKFVENHFFQATEQPLSTFSLDVDAASYSNMRRMINQGQLPPKDAVRIEELVNYFSYNYPQPTDGYPVNIVTETTTCPWANKHKLVRIGVKAKEIPSENLPASNFVFLLDVSGSMQYPNKLELVKSSLKLLVNNLRKKDRVSIVVYAGAAGEVLSSTEGTDKQKILDAIEKLNAGGSTAGGEGIQLAYDIAAKNFIQMGNNRIILCTDGDFNVGVSSTSDLESLIETKRKTGVFLTVLGYGMGNYKDNKLKILSQKGNGNYAYIDNLQEANKVLVNEFGSTMYTVAKDVKLQVEFNPAFVNAYRLIGYESRLLNKEDFNDDTKDAGELGSGHTVTALYEIIPVGVENRFGSVDKLKYQKSKNSNAPLNTTGNSSELLTVKLRYKKPDGNTSLKMEIPVFAKDVTVNPSVDFKFVMAVTMFGQLLRDSDFKGNSTYDMVLDYARNGIGEDNRGYRKEFIRLVESINQLTQK